MQRRNAIKGLTLLPFIGGSPIQYALSKPPQPSQDTNKSMYTSLGVRPVINGRGTITVIGGCRMLPEVQRAMEEATHDYVELDELAHGVGKRLGELTGAEWGVVTTGATGALIIATTGIVTGGDPDKLWQLPDLTGMKNEVIIPAYSWTAYESAVRGVGVKMITVHDKKELEAALGPNTAMVLILAGSRSEHGPLSTHEIALLTKPLGVPILVDAAAEGLPVPNPHIAQGADLVAYSGGKYLAGPQCAGLLIGRKDLIQAAWMTSAPHHGFARGYKVGREEVLGMLAAVEMWMKRDHTAEIRTWTKQLQYIVDRINGIPGVTTSIHQPRGRSNPSPGMAVEWDMQKIPLTGYDVENLLWEGNPRVAVSGAGSFLPFPPSLRPNIRIDTSQLHQGEEKIIAEQVYKVLSNPPNIETPSGNPRFDISGEWDFELTFAAGKATQRFVLRQTGNNIQGTQFGTYATRDLIGSFYGDDVLLRSSYTDNGVRLNFEFRGMVDSKDSMGGSLSLSEYGMASWKASRHTISLK